MLTPELVDALQAPISDASPCGDDLEYDPAFTALETAAQGKAEQQFGDTVIAAVEPEWRAVADQAQALLGRAKDVRVAVLLLLAATLQQGAAGFVLGLELLAGLLDRYWDGIHPERSMPTTTTIPPCASMRWRRSPTRAWCCATCTTPAWASRAASA